ncbi:uncharacterized protein LOC120198511 [Hibiscus syriacus]|uniref:uncharacterized protein LOC120198511 n=1 Tax=Hibiscus syriacus TaxID=106335 RepID=UPI001920AA52|nr:uncharacterized protein LOC120198511 [Hibiscus syriacus]
METDEGLRPVEFLRGRLLAERQASKTAKQDAQLIGNKLMELEKELKEETKLRNKAEKRLKLLRKKLESRKSERHEVSCVSSTSSSYTTITNTNDFSHEKSSVESSSGHEVPKVDDTRLEIDNGRNENYEDDDSVDDSLALVPFFLPETKVTPEIKIVNRSIGEVLETLRHARERIQSSMERRQMIRVGPS